MQHHPQDLVVSQIVAESGGWRIQAVHCRLEQDASGYDEEAGTR